MKIKKVLIANRGEIAVRIIKTLREMGIKAATIYSNVDRNSLHIKLADEAYKLHNDDYLNIDDIIAIAQNINADAIHPGYGFLSENYLFPKACEKNSIIFIGPSSKLVKQLGNKTAARTLANRIKIPINKGTRNLINEDTLYEKAIEIGFPVIVKAAEGGGGRGMRIVKDKNDFKKLLSTAQNESEKAFGSRSVYIEKYIEDPRHVEVQILADKFGNVIHLGERDCTVQRRHQKLLEEAPSAFVNRKIMRKIYDSAIKLMKKAKYVNAGTVEFLVDKQGNYYFMEVNTRIQVEHPVTEMITGVDLIKEQILIAQGEEMKLRQSDIHFTGHAIECRINAEDPEKGFIPSIGQIENILFPRGANVRIESAVYSGYQIPPNYDSMIAKILVHGKTRDEAIMRMIHALKNMWINGIKSTKNFHIRLLNNKYFRSGDYGTHFLEEKYYSEGHSSSDKEIVGAALAYLYILQQEKKNKIIVDTPSDSNWKQEAMRDMVR